MGPAKSRCTSARIFVALQASLISVIRHLRLNTYIIVKSIIWSRFYIHSFNQLGNFLISDSLQ